MTSLINALPGSISQGLIWGIMAIGVYITYRLLDVADLTVDGSFCTGGAMCAVTLANGKDWLGALFGADAIAAWSPAAVNTVILILAVLFALFAGLLAGFCTGMLHTACGIPAILAGILTQLGLWSVNLVSIMGKKSTISIAVGKVDLLVAMRYMDDVEKGKRWFIQHPIFVTAVFTIAIIALLYWFFGTELGSSLRATGANRAMARAQGINTNRNTVLGLMISNGLVALSGALLAQYQGFAEINMGRGAIVIGLAAVIIGEVIFGKLFVNFGLKLLAVSIGAVIYYIVIQAVISLSGIDSNYLKLLTAIIVAIFLAVPYWKGRYFSKPVKRGGAANA